jgi:type IV pilus assembly protein PilF
MFLPIVVLLVSVLSGCTNSMTEPNTNTDELTGRLVELGIGYIRTREYRRALEHLNRAAEINPKSPTVHNALALAFQMELEFDLAERHFLQAVKYGPEVTRIYNNYGAFLFERERYVEAIEQLRIAAEDQYYDGRAVVFENLGMSYLKINDPVAAEDAFVRGLALNSEQPRALLELGDIRAKQQNYVEARDLYDRYRRGSEHNAKSLWLCIRLARVFDGKNDEASCSLMLRNIYPASQEYMHYEQTLGE